MPDSGTPYFLPYPALSDQCDAPKFIGDLARAQHARLGDLAPRIARQKTTSQALTTGVTARILYDLDIPGQGTPGITYTSDGYFTVQTPGVYMINVVQHIQSGSTTTQRLMLAAYNESSNLILNNYAWSGSNHNVSLSRCHRFLAGENFSVRIYVVGTGGVAYGLAGGSPYSCIDATWICS